MRAKEISGIRAIAFDLDGVVYFGSKPADGIVDVISQVRRLGLKVYFMTNNSAKTRSEIANKLNGMGIEVSKDEILTSGFAAALFIDRSAGKERKALILGTDSLKREFSELGFSSVSAPPCDYLVVGYDTEFNFEKICIGLTALLNGALFVACNRVANFPSEEGNILPGLGAMVGAIIGASNKEPDILVGKPNTLMMEYLTEMAGLAPHEILCVGDSLEEDIAMASRFGSLSVLVSGNNVAAQYPKLRGKKVCSPDFVIRSVVELAELLRLKVCP